MKEITSVAIPSCFHRWRDRFNDVFKTFILKKLGLEII